MKKRFRILLSALMALAAGQGAKGADYTPSYRLIDTPDYYSEDLGVATFNALDYGVDNTGNSDCTDAVQKLLDACGGVGVGANTRGYYRNPSGGTVYFPAGTYLFTGQLTIPRGVSIRGDWNKPTPGQSITGTIFSVKPTRGKGITSPSYAFITMQPSTLVTNIAFWYPDQKPSSIKKYPATILYGEGGYWGNDYCNVRHCTFVNSYIGIQFNPNNGGGCPNINDIYGTPLYEGFEMDRIADVGRFDGIDFSPAYWEGSGLPDSPADGEIDEWLLDNATAVVMRRNDWSYTCNLKVDGYKIGFHAEASPVEGRPNGHNYGFDLRNCRTGVQISCASGSGIMFTNVQTTGCDKGVSLLGGAEGPVQFYGCNLSGKEAAISMDDDATSALMFQDCNISGTTYAGGGHFQAVNNTFGRNVFVSAKARTLFADNKFTSGAELVNKSIFKCMNESYTGRSYPELPLFKREEMQVRVTKPARAALYVVTDPEFGAVPFTDITLEPSTQADCSDAIQKALDKAGQEGGGIVYLPKGHYPCRKELRIPQGVELKGCADIPTVPKNHGAVLEVLTGEGNENGTPFISMDKKSGLRGVTVNYPSQNDPLNVKAYPYTVRGNADCYVVNLALRAAYRGLDLFTNKCDRHYVDYLAGHAFMNVVRIGGNSADGIFANTQCNTIVYACGDETKFGSWPNSMPMKDDNKQHQAYCQNERDLDFLAVGDCTNEFLYNNFLFGCAKGMWFIPDNNGGARHCKSLGNAVDGAIETFVIDGVATDLDMVNSQIVALDHNPSDPKHSSDISPYIPACFIRTGSGVSGKKVRFFSSNNWGGGDYMTDIKSGTVVIAMTNMNASGEKSTFKSAEGAAIEVFNGRFNNMKKTLETNGDAARTSVETSVIEYKNGSVPAAMTWKCNLLPAWEFTDLSGMANRKGWTATASVNSGNADRAIDGVTSTRWDTGAPQTAGQWFSVDFHSELDINTIILDSSASGNSDGPAAYKVEAFVGGTWQQIAEGSNGGATCVVTFEPVKASKIKVTQTGSKGNYWSIHEFYAAMLDISGVSELEAEGGKANISIRGGILSVNGGDTAHVEIYDMSGRMTMSETGDAIDITRLQSGVYVAVARTSEGIAVLKFAK